MALSKITQMADEHRRKIRAFGGDPDHPDVKKEYLLVVNLWAMANGHNTISDDRLLSIARLHLREDYDKPKFVPNGGAGLSPKQLAEQQKAQQEKAGAL
jgi:hypothetical protein